MLAALRERVSQAKLFLVATSWYEMKDKIEERQLNSKPIISVIFIAIPIYLEELFKGLLF
jgi:hypothetical protein